MIWLLLGLGLAAAAEPSAEDDRRGVRLLRIDSAQASPALFPGPFDRAPVPQWVAELPGKRVNSASHAERARPVFAGDRILVGAAGGQALYALSRLDGSLVATFPADGAVESEPVVDGDQVFFGDSAGTSWCYQLDGTLVWRHPGTSPLPTRPTLDAEHVYLRDVDDLVVALDRKTGEIQWRYQRKADPGRISELTLYAAPPAVIAGEIALVGFSDGALVALDRSTGDLRWDLSIGEGRYPDIVAPPVVVGRTVFASGYLEPLVALDLDSSSVRWRVDAGSASAGGVLPTAEGTTLLLHPGTDGVLRAVDPVAGDLRWSWDSERGGALTEPVQTEAGLLIGSAAGPISLVDPADGTTRWSWHGDHHLDGLTAAPSVDGRQVVFTTNAGRVHAMLVPSPSVRPRRPQDDFDLVGRPRDGWGRDR